MLFCAVTICSCSVYKRNLHIASLLFKTYVENYICLYGKHTIGSNVHNLVHIVEDMVQNNIGNLMQISTYKFENSLRLMGLMLQNCNHPLEQIARRIIENSKLDQDPQIAQQTKSFIPFVEFKFDFESGKRYQKIHIKPNLFLSCRKDGDKWFLSRSGQIVKMQYVMWFPFKKKICSSRSQ